MGRLLRIAVVIGALFLPAAGATVAVSTATGCGGCKKDCRQGCCCGSSCINCSYECHKADEEVIDPEGNVVPIDVALIDGEDETVSEEP